MEQPKDHIDQLPRMRLTAAEFLALPEYNTTFPTGATPGKRWRRLQGAHAMNWRNAGGQPYWMIGQYDPDAAPGAKEITIFWFKPVITVPAVEVVQMAPLTPDQQQYLDDIWRSSRPTPELMKLKIG